MAAERRITWGALIRTGALGITTSLVFLMVASLVSGAGVDPIMPIVAALFGFGAFWQGRWRGGATFVFVITILWFLLIVVLFGGIASLARPASWIELTVTMTTIAATVVVVVAYVRGRRAFDAVAAPGPTILRGAYGVVILAVLVGLVASITTKSDPVEAGDLRVTAKKFEFSPTKLTAKAGPVSVFLDNQDPSQHNFNIEGVIRIDAPSFHARRGKFIASPGTYAFTCTLHPDMKGTLTVS